MEYFKDKNKRKGLITTVFIHLALLVIFLFTGLIIPVPLPEQGILINFGTSDEGMGAVQPEDVSKAKTTEENTEKTDVDEPPVPTENPEKIITQNMEEAPAVNEKLNTPIENKVKEEKEPEPVINPASLYKGKANNDADDNNEGVTGTPGDQGSEDGVYDSKNYGDNNGTGKGFFLAGRKIIDRPAINENTQETGRVVVNIWVNRYGQVIRATPGAKGSTTTSSHLYNIAKEAALKAAFSPSRDAPEEQKGTLSSNFTLIE